MVKIIGKDRTLQLQISDNGRGISDTERVFEKGVSSKGAGRGLGLYLIRKRIKREGGSISLHSEPGNTCFTIEIPQKNGEKQ